MGKASSNKKVARAAGTGGGRTAGGRIAWTYYGVIALVAVLGIAGTVVSRNSFHSKQNATGGTPPAIGTTWNEGVGFYACGKFLPDLPVSKDPEGIKSNGNGIIHIDPTTKSAAGKNATVGKFAQAVGMKLNAGELQLPGGKLYQAGADCNGKAAHIYVKQFAFVGATTGQIQNSDPRDVKLQDQALLTVAFVPPSQEASIPVPPKSVQTALQKLGASTSTSSTTTATTTPGATTPATTAPATTTPATTTPATTTPASPTTTTGK